jgi:hypothetical protein
MFYLESFQIKCEVIMRKNKWIPLKDVKDEDKIWPGSKVRLYNVGLNVSKKSDDYYDYLVSYIYGNHEFLQLTNLSQGEAGNILCVVKKDLPNHYSLGKTLKVMIDNNDCYVFFE